VQAADSADTVDKITRPANPGLGGSQRLPDSEKGTAIVPKKWLFPPASRRCAVLAGLGLMSGEKIDRYASPYARHILDLLNQKGHGQVINRAELVQDVYGSRPGRMERNPWRMACISTSDSGWDDPRLRGSDRTVRVTRGFEPPMYRKANGLPSADRMSNIGPWGFP